jgi:ferrous-iron efflux pump FieF
MAEAATLPLSENAAAQRLRRRATYAALAVAGVLIAAKLAAWISTGSVALLSSLVDSLVDAIASLVNFFAVRHAFVPADREHRFGHGKAEPLAALGQSAFLVGSAVLLMMEAVRRLVSPEPIADASAGVGVMLFSIVVTIGLVTYQRHVVRHTGSLAIGADELHYRGDLILNGGVIATLLLSGVYIRTRIAGPTAFIQLHLEMDGAINLLHAHEISDAVEMQLRRAFPHAEIMIHEDPAGIEEPVAFPSRTAAR